MLIITSNWSYRAHFDSDYYYQLCCATWGLKYSLLKSQKWAHLVSRMVIAVVFQLLSCVLLVTPRAAAHQASLSFTIAHNLLKQLSNESMDISSSVIPFSSCPESFPASGSFPISLLFASGGQNFGGLVSASGLPVNIQGWFPLDQMLWSPCCPKDSQESSPAHLA